MVFFTAGPRDAPIHVKPNTISKEVMLDWIRECEASGSDMPTDEAIMDRFAFTSLEQARTLLADLSDEGRIRISYHGDHRQISTDRPAPTPRLKFERPKNARSERLDRIAQIAEKLKASKPEKKARKEEPLPPPSPPKPVIGTRPAAVVTSKVTEAPAPAPEVAPEPASPQPSIAAPVTKVKDGRNPCTHITLRIDRAVKRDVVRRATEREMTINAYLVEVLMGALYTKDGTSVPPVEMDVATTARSLVSRERSANRVLLECIEALTPWIIPDRKMQIRCEIAAEALRLGKPVIDLTVELAMEAMTLRMNSQTKGE